MIVEDYCSYEITKLLKEKGFEKSLNWRGGIHISNDDKPLDKVTHQTALAWLRKEYYIWCDIVWEGKNDDGNIQWCAAAFDLKLGKYIPDSFIRHNNSYEGAVEAILEYVLKNEISQ